MQGGFLLGDPVFYALAGALPEGYAEGAVAAVTTAGSKMLGRDGLARGYGLAVETYKVIDAQHVDIGIVSGALASKILAEV